MTNLRFGGRTAIGAVVLSLLAASGAAFGQAVVVDPAFAAAPRAPEERCRG